MSFGWPSMLAAGALGAYAIEKGKDTPLGGVAGDLVRGFSKNIGDPGSSSSGRSFATSSSNQEVRGPPTALSLSRPVPFLIRRLFALTALGSQNRSLTTLLPPLFLPPSQPIHPQPQLVVLQGEVDRLHRLLSDVVHSNSNRSPAYMVLQQGRSVASVMAIPTILGGLVIFGVCKYKGWNLWDFFFVTRQGLESFKCAVQQNFSKLWEEMSKQKAEFLDRISGVSKQQEELLLRQQQLDEQVGRVGRNVDDIRSNTTLIGTRVEMLDGRMSDVTGHVMYATEGIKVLCAAVHDVCNRAGMNNAKTTQLLKNWASTAPVANNSTHALPCAGLKGLLGGGDSGITEGPAMLMDTPDLLKPAASAPVTVSQRGGFFGLTGF